jgi:hypothetical protein
MRTGWTLLAVTLALLGARTGRAAEVIGSTGPMPPGAVAGVSGPAPAGPVSGTIMAGPGPCLQPCCCPELCDVGGCLRRLWDWLTYRAESHCCSCGCKCNPCGLPHLYIFFLCHHGGCCPPRLPCAGCALDNAPWGGAIALPPVANHGSPETVPAGNPQGGY